MKKITLTKGKFALVDDEDYDFLMQRKWFYSEDRKGGYAVSFKNKKKIKMHRVVNKTPKGFQTDHINCNKLDNRKCNLRTTNQSQNCMNREKYNNSTSKYKGVSWHKATNKWISQIKINNKVLYLGVFLSQKEAAKTYDKKAKKLFGKYARINNIGE